jgi:hypothetical protein
MLSTYGSDQAEAPLWRAFDAWHRRWSTRVSTLEEEHRKREESWDDSVEGRLVWALHGAVGWSLDESDYDRLAAVCLSASCHDSVENARRQHRDPEITAFGLDPETRRARYLVGSTVVETIAQLQTKVLQFPQGTNFLWDARSGISDVEWRPEEQRIEYDRVAGLLRRHGMSLSPRQR